MKKRNLCLLLLGCIMFFDFNSCINKDYDWDNLNNEVTLEIGNMPLGDIATLWIDSILCDRGSMDFEYDKNGAIILKYKGNIDITLPGFKTIEDIERTTGLYTIPPLSEEEISGKQLLSVIENEPLPYSMSMPDQEEGNNWSIDVKKATFQECNLYIYVHINDFYADNPNDNSSVLLRMQFPDAFKMKAHPQFKETNILEATIPLISEQNVYKIGPFPIESFQYNNEEEIIYLDIDLALGIGSTPIYGENPLMYLQILTTDIEPSLVYGVAAFAQEITETFDDINSLNDLFGEDGSFIFKNPGILMTMNTNIGFTFNMFIDKIEGFKPDTLSAIIYDVTDSDGMIFLPPEREFAIKETTYYLAGTNDMDNSNFIRQDLNDVITIKPKKLAYDIRTIIPENDNYGFIPYSLSGPEENKPEIQAFYTLNLPLYFEQMSICFEEKFKDTFSSDIADKLFSNEEEFIIAADLVEVQIGGPGSNADADVEITAKIYDARDEAIDITIESTKLKNGENSMEIIMHIEEEDVAKMKNAKHLAFIFKIDGKDVILNKSDYISIKKLKFKSSGGLSWEL